MLNLFPTTRYHVSNLSDKLEQLGRWNMNLFEEADSLFTELNKFFDEGTNSYSFPEPSKYPPTNIVKTESGYSVELAIAGYAKDDLEVTLENNILTVSGAKISQEQSETKIFIQKGISSKSFTKNFTIPNGATVSSVALENGLLTLDIDVPKSEEKAPKKEVLKIKAK